MKHSDTSEKGLVGMITAALTGKNAVVTGELDVGEAERGLPAGLELEDDSAPVADEDRELLGANEAGKGLDGAQAEK